MPAASSNSVVDTVFLRALHRLMAPATGTSDRAAEKWRLDYQIEGADDLSLHHLYRAMAWLGEALPHDQQHGATAPGMRCVKDLIEERLFEQRRDLFTDLSLVFFQIDQQKVKDEARFDGKWVLRTNWHEGDAADVALRYKDLWIVEAIFRTMKSLLETRPIYHRCDETIRGHVFCSFLVLVLRKTLQDRLAQHGITAEWADVLGDLDRLRRFEVIADGTRCTLRTSPTGTAGRVLQATGIALGPAVQFPDAPPGSRAEGESVVPNDAAMRATVDS